MFGITETDLKEVSIETVPSSIFRDRSLAPLESISEFLKENKGLTYHEIAVLVGRDDRTIWTCCHRAKKKRENHPAREDTDENCIEIPLSIFKDRTLAPLEKITSFVKELKHLSYHEIAALLNRDDRTIWTCYNRAQKKLAKQTGGEAS
ncbi:hypothetical protein ACFL3V_04595 [Nanoarchaeota archaeon]